jgi:hypothetical protein
MTYRAPKKIITLPPVREVEEIELDLSRAARQARCTFSEIRRRAYRMFLYGDPFCDPGGEVVHGRSVFPESTFDQESRVSPSDAT